MTWFSYTLWILAISTVALPILILAAGLAFRNVGQEKKQERSRFTKWLGAQSSYLPLALALFGLFLVAMRVMHEDAWRWFGKQGAFFCWSLAIGLGALCLLCPKSGLQWVGLGLIILFAVQFLETPVSRGLQKLEELRGEETMTQPTMEMARETEKWLMSAQWPERGYQRNFHPAKLVEDTNNRKVFHYFGLSAGRNYHGVIQLEETDNHSWSGRWQEPGKWGLIVLTEAEGGNQFTGSWQCPDDPRPEYQKGGNVQLIRQ